MQYPHSPAKVCKQHYAVTDLADTQRLWAGRATASAGCGHRQEGKEEEEEGSRSAGCRRRRHAARVQEGAPGAAGRARDSACRLLRRVWAECAPSLGQPCAPRHSWQAACIHICCCRRLRARLRAFLACVGRMQAPQLRVRVLAANPAFQAPCVCPVQYGHVKHRPCFVIQQSPHIHMCRRRLACRCSPSTQRRACACQTHRGSCCGC